MKHLKHSVRWVTTIGLATAMALTIGRACVVLPAMAMSGRWMRVRTLGHNTSEAKVFLAADTRLRPLWWR
jgi:hypothetical protein